MLKTIYTETELRNKLSKYANERIESIACDGVQIQIIFKAGYATSFLSSDSCDTEIYFNSIASMKEACKKLYLDEGQENLEKAKAKEEQERQQQEEKKEDNNMNKDLYTVKKEFEDGKKQVFTKCGYVFKSTGIRHDLVKNLSELDEIVTVEEYNKIFWSDYKADFSNVDAQEALKALEKVQPKEDKQEDKKEDKAPLSSSLGGGEREQPNLENDFQEIEASTSNDSQEITSLRLDLTDSERSAIHYLFELEKDRYNGKEWTDKEKAQAQKALDTLTYLGILDKFPDLHDFNPQSENLDEFKFYKSESFYEGGYLPTAHAIDFLELTYTEIVEHDKVMALLQIPLNVLNVTEYIEVLPNDILRVHLKQGFQYQGHSFIDATVGEYQAFEIEDIHQVKQIQIFDLDIEQEPKKQKGFNGLTEYEKVKSRIDDLKDLINYWERSYNGFRVNGYSHDEAIKKANTRLLVEDVQIVKDKLNELEKERSKLLEKENDYLEHFEEYKEQDLKQLQEALFDVDNDLERLESIEEQTFINNYCYKKTSFEDARNIAVQTAELATGTTKNALLDKRIDIESKISTLKLSLQEFKAYCSQPIKY